MAGIEETIRALMLPSCSHTYIGDAPVDVDECAWVRADSGNIKNHFDKSTYDYPTYVVYVRAKDNESSKGRIYDIYHILNNYVGEGFIIVAENLPRYNGRDNKHRATYSFRITYQLGGY